MRALEVVKQLQTVQSQTGRLKGVQFRPYSAAQLQLPSGEFAIPIAIPMPIVGVLKFAFRLWVKPKRCNK